MRLLKLMIRMVFAPDSVESTEWWQKILTANTSSL